jgi:hypothetical protein
MAKGAKFYLTPRRIAIRYGTFQAKNRSGSEPLFLFIYNGL